MSETYLFRIDSAKDNDEFFGNLCPTMSQVYAGVDLRVGISGWTPDFVRIVLDETQTKCVLTLIELESTQSAAFISCRKYLPENSTGILVAFMDYLDRVIRQCQSTADSRKDEFVHLKNVLSRVGRVTVTTAGALRSSTRFEEELPLMDQPDQIATAHPVQQNHLNENRHFSGFLRLSAGDAKALVRTVLILDAVVRGRDHSDATFHAWRGQKRSQPLKYFLRKNSTRYPALRSFVFETASHGITLDFEMVLSELVEIWSSVHTAPVAREQTRSLINRYFPKGSSIRSHERMPAIFETARKYMADELD